MCKYYSYIHIFIYSCKDGKDELINNIGRQQHKNRNSLRYVRQITNCKTGLVSFFISKAKILNLYKFPSCFGFSYFMIKDVIKRKIIRRKTDCSERGAYYMKIFHCINLQPPPHLIESTVKQIQQIKCQKSSM